MTGNENDGWGVSVITLREISAKEGTFLDGEIHLWKGACDERFAFYELLSIFNFHCSLAPVREVFCSRVLRSHDPG